MENRPKPIVYCCHLGIHIWILFSGFLDQEPFSIIIGVLNVHRIIILRWRVSLEQPLVIFQVGGVNFPSRHVILKLYGNGLSLCASTVLYMSS
jgi:hypothetical protein